MSEGLGTKQWICGQNYGPADLAAFCFGWDCAVARLCQPRVAANQAEGGALASAGGMSDLFHRQTLKPPAVTLTSFRFQDNHQLASLSHLCPSFLQALGLGHGPGSVHQPDVAQRLGEIAQQLSSGGIDLLSKQADVVDEGYCSFEDGAGSGRLPGEGHGLSQPECAQEKCAFVTLPSWER